MKQKVIDAINENKGQIDKLLKDYNIDDIKIISPDIYKKELFFSTKNIHFFVTYNKEKATQNDILAFIEEMEKLFESKDISIEIHTENSMGKAKSLSTLMEGIIQSALSIDSFLTQKNTEKKAPQEREKLYLNCTPVYKKFRDPVKKINHNAIKSP